MRRASWFLLVLAAALPVAAAAAPPDALRPQWANCPQTDPTVYVSLSGYYHIPSVNDGSTGRYMCRSDAEKSGAKPGRDVLISDAKARAAARAAGSAAPSPSPTPVPSSSPGSR
jgi:hypothetical protein